jgi:PKHD-type hydroxylase
MNQHDPRKIREQLGVDQNTLLSPQAPQPNIVEGSLLDCLSHNGIFSEEECRQIVRDFSPEEWDEAGMNRLESAEESHQDHKWRHTLNTWIPKEEKSLWIFDKMLALTMSANAHKWQFEVDFFEAIQLAKYEEGMHYEWHNDLGPGMAGNRKLSITVQLSSPDEYEGGELLLDNSRKEAFTAPKEIGSVTVFPSFMKHKVAPVTKGTRYSLVVWVSGTNRFR